MRRVGILLLLACTTISSWNLAADAPDTSGVLKLQIRGRDGAGVEGATVHSALESAPDWTARSPSDASGKAVLGLEAGSYWISVRAEGFLDWTKLTRVDRGQRANLQIQLTPGGTIAGRVIGTDDHPVADANFCLERNDERALPAELAEMLGFEDDRLCARATSSGSVGPLAIPYESYELTIEAEGRVSIGETLSFEQPAEHRVWLMRAGGEVTARIENADEQPVRGAAFYLTHRQRDLEVTGATDEDGRFTVGGLQPGYWKLRLDPPDGMSVHRDGLVVGEGARLDLGTLRMKPGSAMHGSVVDSRGRGLADCEVRAHQGEPPHRLLRRTASDDEGQFVLGGLPAGEAITLIVDPPSEYVPRQVEDVEPTAKKLEFEVDEAGSVCGVVEVESGKRPEKIVVTADSRLEGMLRRLPDRTRARTDEVDEFDGSFCIAGVIPGAEIEVSATAPGYWAEDRKVEVRAGEETAAIALLLRRGLSLVGDIIDSDGEAVGAASISSSFGPRVFSDSRGEFVLDGLRPGMNRLSVIHTDYAHSTQDVMTPMAEGERVRIELSAGGSIEGRVSDPDGEPVPSVSIELLDSGEQTLSDAQGRYRFDHVESGSRSVRRGGGEGLVDFEIREAEVAAGRTVRVDFAIGAVLEGRVTRAGAPVGGAAIALARPENWEGSLTSNYSAQQTASDGDGNYRLAGVRQGWASLTIRTGRQRLLRPVEIPGGANPRLDLNLPDRLVPGRVIADIDGSPIVGAVIEADLPVTAGAPVANNSSYFSQSDGLGQSIEYGMTSVASSRTESDAQGNFELFVDGTAPSTVNVYDHGFASESREIDPASLSALEFRLAREYQLTLRLRDPQGRPVQRTEACFIRYTDGGQSSMCSSGGGTDVTQSLREGSYTLLAAAPGFGTQVVEDLPIAVTPEETSGERTIQLAPGARLVVRLVGQAMENAEVRSLTDPQGRQRSLLVRGSTIDPGTGDKRWTTWPLNAGTWQVVLDVDGQPMQREIEIVPGPDMELLFP